jgi:hypothetical protein
MVSVAAGNFKPLDSAIFRPLLTVEYWEFVVATLESLSAKFDEELGRDAPQGLAAQRLKK